MSKVKVAGLSVSLDGFSACADQSLEHPLGKRGDEIFQWFFPTKTFRTMIGKDDGETGPDDDFGRRAMAGFGAFILGRNMFGPVRGAWPDENWKGWWGDTPPYRAPTFILTHHPRPPIEMLGGTTFYFVSEGIDVALQKARAAGRKDIKIGGGVGREGNTSRPAMSTKSTSLSRVAIGQSEPLFSGIVSAPWDTGPSSTCRPNGRPLSCWRRKLGIIWTKHSRQRRLQRQSPCRS